MNKRASDGSHLTIASGSPFSIGIKGKTFFNFDDQAFNEHIARFLRERYPNRSRFEKG
jgi:hypothetical protein